MSIINVIKSTGIYFIGSVLSKIVVFLLLPIYTGYISPEKMGIYDTGVTIITLFSSMLFLDIGSVILKFTLEKESKNASQPITNGSVIFTFSCLVYLLILLFVRTFFKYEYFALVVIYGLTYAFNNAVGYVARALHYNTDYAVAGVLQTILMVVLNIIMLVGFNVDYKSLYISFSLSSFLSSLYLILRTQIYKYIKLSSISKQKLMEMLRFSLPLCVNSMAFWFLSSSGRVIVTYVLGTEATGYLSVANKFNQVLYLVSSCVHLTWQEAAFSHDNTNESQKCFYSGIFIVYYRIVLFCVMLLMPLIKIGLVLFPTFINAKYSVSINLIPTALIGTGLAIISQFLGTIFSSLKKTAIVFVSTLTGAFVTVVSTFLFIYMGLGAEAANLSFIMGYISTIVIRIALLKKHINFNCEVKNLIWLVPSLLISMYISRDTTIMVNIILLIIMLCITPIIFTKEIKVFRRKIHERQ